MAVAPPGLQLVIGLADTPPPVSRTQSRQAGVGRRYKLAGFLLDFGPGGGEWADACLWGMGYECNLQDGARSMR